MMNGATLIIRRPIVLSGAEIGAVVGMLGGPFGAIAGAVIAGLAGAAAGCATGTALGETFDQKVLDNWHCRDCGHIFTILAN
ncbi:hypothetical protein [Paraburkholderia ultramafica]|nr:hypothetical protein [Paraburkholderia ultramafica]